MSKWSDDEKVQRARAMLHGLCDGSKRFTMSVPVRLDEDSDMVLSDGLDVAEQRGRAILDIRERAEKAEHLLKNAGVCELAAGNVNVASYVNEWEGRTAKAEQRCAALEAALRAFVGREDLKLGQCQCGNKSDVCIVQRAIETLSGDTSALREMLERAAYLAHQDSSAFGNEDASAYVNAATAIAKRVMEGL